MPDVTITELTSPPKTLEQTGSEKKVSFPLNNLYTKQEAVFSKVSDSQPGREVTQGSGLVAQPEESLTSKEIGDCFALILQNENTGKTALFHVDANRSTQIDRGVLNQLSEGGGVVSVQAVRGTKSIESKPTKDLVAEQLLTNVAIYPDIQVDTGSSFWEIDVDSAKNTFTVRPENAEPQQFQRQESSKSEPKKLNETEQECLVDKIISDRSNKAFIGLPNQKSPEDLLATINDLATIVPVTNRSWIKDWILASQEDKASISSVLLAKRNPN